MPESGGCSVPDMSEVNIVLLHDTKQGFGVTESAPKAVLLLQFTVPSDSAARQLQLLFP